jgi:hypothetical protein
MTTFQEITSENASRLPDTGIEQWDRDGVLILKDFIPHDLIDTYVEERKQLLGETKKWRPGWNGPCPFTHVSSMLKLATYRPLTLAMKPLIGNREPGLHLCLSGFQSTERRTHADAYLNPAGVDDFYLASWIALDDIHPDSGPFEFVGGSHKWPSIQREKVWQKMREKGQDPTLPTWPSDSQGWVGDACEDEIKRRDSSFQPFLPNKGDVLIWAANLLHRGSLPKDRALERRSLISHYSAIDKRPDMSHLVKLENGSFRFEFPGYQEPGDSTHRSKR